MKNRIKEWLRRWAIRQLIKLVDRAEERLQAWQVSLRNDLCGRKPVGGMAASIPAKPAKSGHASPTQPGRPQSETFLQWEARRAGVAPVSKQSARRRRMTAAEFDLRFAR